MYVPLYSSSLTKCYPDNSETQDIELLLQQVVEIDFSRIATRLRLNNKYSAFSSPLARVQKVLEKHDADVCMLDQVKKLVGISQELKHLPLCSHGQASRACVASILKQIHDLVYLNSLTLIVNRIDRGVDTARAIDSLQKIGNYYRATRQLTTAARRKKCHLFRNIRVMSFDIKIPATVRKPAKRGESMALIRSLVDEVDGAKLLKQFQGSDSVADGAIVKKLNEARSGLKIHAEIKLLLFYECHPQPRQPRLIAASKSSCYLCDQFCRIHGAFQVLATYGTFNERWLLPDWVNPYPGTRLGESVRQFDRKLNTLLRELLQHTRRQPLPIESLVGLSASWSSLTQLKDSTRRQVEAGSQTEASVAGTNSISSSRDPPSKHKTKTSGQLTSSSFSDENSGSEQSTSSIIEVFVGSLPFSQRIYPGQESIRVLLGNLFLIFEFLQNSSGTLQIRRQSETLADCVPIIDVLDIPITARLLIACSEDSLQLSAGLRSTNNDILILSFDWSAPEASVLQTVCS